MTSHRSALIYAMMTLAWAATNAAATTSDCGPAIQPVSGSSASTAPAPTESTALHSAGPDPAVPPRRRARVATKSSSGPAARQAAWWPSHQEGKLNIVAVRPGEFSRCIVIETDGVFENTDVLSSAISVKRSNGEIIQNRWAVAASKNVLLLPVEPGQYQVFLDQRLLDMRGRAIAKGASGLVQVR